MQEATPDSGDTWLRTDLSMDTRNVEKPAIMAFFSLGLLLWKDGEVVPYEKCEKEKTQHEDQCVDSGFLCLCDFVPGYCSDCDVHILLLPADAGGY